MSRFLPVCIFVLLFSLNFQQVFAREFSFEENMIKMEKYYQEKAYNKALKLAAKTKKEELNEEQKELLEVFMTLAIEYKQLDDAVKYFLVEYNKYEDYFIYRPSSTIFISMIPYVLAYSDGPIYKLKFETTYYSPTRMYPDLVILYADGKRYEFKPFSSYDKLISYDTHKRRVYAWVNLTDREAYLVSEASKAGDVSFLIKDTKLGKSAEGILMPMNKEKIRDAYTLYNLLKFKKLERGKNRF